MRVTAISVMCVLAAAPAAASGQRPAAGPAARAEVTRGALPRLEGGRGGRPETPRPGAPVPWPGPGRGAGWPLGWGYGVVWPLLVVGPDLVIADGWSQTGWYQTVDASAPRPAQAERRVPPTKVIEVRPAARPDADTAAADTGRASRAPAPPRKRLTRQPPKARRGA